MSTSFLEQIRAEMEIWLAPYSSRREVEDARDAIADALPALLDVAEAAQDVALGPVTVANRARLAEAVAALDDLLPQDQSE